MIDGLDASGKTTQAEILAKKFAKEQKTVCLRTHPSDDNFFGLQARRFLFAKGKNAHFASAVFYMFDVLRSVTLFSWRKFDHIIFVRYLMGTAYLPSPLHKIGYCFFSSILPKSENMFFLDVTPKEAHRRINENRINREIFEEINALKKIRMKALALIIIDQWKIISGDNPSEQVTRQIISSLTS